MGGAILFDQDIKTWDTKAVTNMKNMFNGAAAFNKELLPATNKWDTSAVTSMEGMFEGAAKFNNADQDTMKDWDTKKVTNMASMFKGAAVFNLALTEATPKWDTGEVTTMQDMFNGAAKFNKDLTSWKDKLSKVANNVCMWTGATAMEAANKPFPSPATNQPGVIWPACQP